MKKIILVTRPWSFSMTAISVTLGSIIALPSSQFHWGRYVLVLVGAILVHAATNVLNDYFDFKHGVDVAGAPTTLYRRHPLVEGDFTPRFILGLSLTCYAVALVIGIYFVLSYGWVILLFIIIGGIASVFYTADPLQYKYHAMGEVAVFLMWGPLMMTAAYFIQAQHWDAVVPVLLVSIPQGLWVSLVLLANNLKDIQYDDESEVTTLGTLLGRKSTIMLFTSLVAIIYSITVLEMLGGVIPPWGFLTVFSLPIILKLIIRLRNEEPIPPDADPQTAQTGMIYGVVLIAAFLLGRIF
jgi:1,4-dihydroxy-2-naphthoate octaprenyltransferase